MNLFSPQTIQKKAKNDLVEAKRELYNWQRQREYVDGMIQVYKMRIANLNDIIESSNDEMPIKQSFHERMEAVLPNVVDPINVDS